MNTTERSLINFACMIEEIYILKLSNHDFILEKDYTTYQCKTLLPISKLIVTTYGQFERLTHVEENKVFDVIKEIEKDIQSCKKQCYISKFYNLPFALLTRLISKGMLTCKDNQYTKMQNFTINTYCEQVYTLLYVNLYNDIREKAHVIIMQLNKMNLKYNELHIEEDKPEKKPLDTNLSFESELHKLGYNVVRLGEEQRRDLLKNTAIPKLSKKVVIARLEFFIKLGKNNPKFKTGIAMERWEKDLKYVKSL